MITAVDTSVLLDVFGADPKFGPSSKAALRSCLTGGRLVACEVVWAELAGFFPPGTGLQEAMDRLGVDYQAIAVEAALVAGGVWSAYRRRGGKRERMIPDFLIGAHAATVADRLLTRDRGFYRSFFAGLAILDPAVG
jgi:hypothetical protein